MRLASGSECCRAGLATEDGEEFVAKLRAVTAPALPLGEVGVLDSEPEVREKEIRRIRDGRDCKLEGRRLPPGELGTAALLLGGRAEPGKKSLVELSNNRLSTSEAPCTDR